MFGSGTTTLIISNEETNHIMKTVVNSLEESDLLIKGVSKTIKNEGKNKKEDFLDKESISK